MRKPSQDARLPTWAIQIFGLLVVTASAAYAIVTKSNEILLADITFAGGCVGISIFERTKREVQKAMTPPEDEEGG